MKKLNQRRVRFIAEYLANPNATEAARRAGYSPHSAGTTGRSLLRKPDVKAAIAVETARVFERLEIEADGVLQEAARVIFVDLRRALFHEDGTPKGLGEIDGETMAALDLEVRFDKEGRHSGARLRRLDKMAAITLLGKYLKLFTDRVEVTDGRDVAAVIARARERAP